MSQVISIWGWVNFSGGGVVKILGGGSEKKTVGISAFHNEVLTFESDRMIL